MGREEGERNCKEGDLRIEVRGGSCADKGEGPAERREL